jgi:hypothetical protein
MRAQRMRAYRIGSICRLQPWSDGSTVAEEVTLQLAAGAWVEESPRKVLLFYSPEHTMGVGTHTAEALGLCRTVAAEASGRGGAAPVRERRAAESESVEAAVSRLIAAIARAAAARDPLARSVLSSTVASTLEALADRFEAAGRPRKEEQVGAGSRERETP